MNDETTTQFEKHVAESNRLLACRNNGGASPADITAAAQVHATLAVAEQARIANLLAVNKQAGTPFANDAWADIRVSLLGLERIEPPRTSPPLRNPPAPEPEEDFDDGLTEPERVDIERLTIGVFQPLTGAHLAYRIWWLGDIASDEAEDDRTRLLAAKELADYAPQENS